MAKRDYYEVLGVDKNATVEEIKKAYNLNIIRIKTREIRMQKKSLRKQQKLMMY